MGIGLASATVQVLLVEDNPVNQMMTRSQLRKIGCACDVVANGIEALAALDKARYDLVLMDCMMPEMDGYEATRRIRAQERDAKSGRLPIVALTASALESELDKCRDAGMDGHLTKPCSMEDLQAAVRRWVSAVQGGAG